MFTFRLNRPLPLVAAWIAGVVVVAQGCGGDEKIRTYSVVSDIPTASHTTAPPHKTAPRKDRGEATDRMIAAILPADDQAWFLKLVGPRVVVAELEPALEAFFASLRIDAGSPQWELPEGWKTGGEKPMRLATFLLPNSVGEPLELSVIGLPRVGDWPKQVLDNVNRWRGQLGREPLSAALLEEMTTPLSVVEGAIRFDATGWWSSGGMAPPAMASPAATPPKMATQGDVPVGSGDLQHTPPEGWTSQPGSSIRKASLATPAGSTITAFVFPSTAPAMADPLANVNRWRGEVGLDAMTAEGLAEVAEEVPLSGGQATYVELAGPTETTLAVMTPRGGQVWFFKLRGPTEAVETDREAFRQWLATIQL